MSIVFPIMARRNYVPYMKSGMEVRLFSVNSLEIFSLFRAILWNVLTLFVVHEHVRTAYSMCTGCTSNVVVSDVM